MKDKLINIIDFLKSKSDKNLLYYLYDKFKYDKTIIDNLLMLDTNYSADLIVGWNDYRLKNKDIRYSFKSRENLYVLYMVLTNIEDIVNISKGHGVTTFELIDDIFAIIDQYINIVSLYTEFSSYSYGIRIDMIPISNTKYNKTPLYRDSRHIIDMLSKDDGIDYFKSIIDNLNRVFGDYFKIMTFNDEIISIIPNPINSTNESKSNLPNIRKYEIDGFVVYQGKDAESNDVLTFQWSNDNDIWFHASGYPGSHCLIKVKDKLPTEITIRKVAEIAKKNSKAKDINSATIVYCKKKFVKKESGMNKGQVKIDRNNAYFIEV